ncbi:expressed protein [Echinococcus multilocularis]|uniref:Expressed protein n=1 Tax=Echinococcus multilocularis TaxID=6211 RepID=A0A087VXT1_ECHMU|nr:expressed protein [Echinococcus multilocularis]
MCSPINSINDGSNAFDCSSSEMSLPIMRL